MNKLLFIVILAVCGGLEDSSRNLEIPNVGKPEILEVPCTPFSPTNLKLLILELNIAHPEIVYAQACLETGGFTSRIFRENHNLFGMKVPAKRRTLVVGEQYGHAVYETWEDSVRDYLLWQQQFKITPIEKEWQYYRLLDAIYAEDPSYVKVVKIVRKRNENLI